MPQQANCPDCRLDLEPGSVSVTYVGAPRPLRIRLNQVPAMVCPGCQGAKLSPEMVKHLDELGLTVREALGDLRKARSTEATPEEPRRAA